MGSNSSLINKICRILERCFHKQPQSTVKKKITIHHSAGSGSAESAVKLWEKRGKVSTNYYIEKDGTFVLITDEWNQSYASCSGANDKEAVTIEVANHKGAPYWEVSDASIKTLINACVDICKRNGMPGITWTGDKNGTLTVHRMFAATACPGPYLYALMPWIAMEVTARVNGLVTGEIKIPKVTFQTNKQTTTASTNKTNTPATPTKPVTNNYIFNTVDLAPVFDPVYYAERWPDIKKALGTNNEALFYHFCTAGMKEGRKASSMFDPQVYKLRYPDLQNEFGNNWILYYKHYCTCGIKEGRSGL